MLFQGDINCAIEHIQFNLGRVKRYLGLVVIGIRVRKT